MTKITKKSINRTKKASRIALSCTKILLAILCIVIFTSFSSAWENTTFNNSLTTENLNFNLTGSQNITRWLEVPEGIPFLTNAYLNLTGIALGAWNVTYCSYDSVELATTDTVVTDMYFKHDDGTKMYELGTAAANTIYQYTCTTGWDLSTCSYDTVSIGAQDGDSRGIFFSVNGSKLYEIGLTSDKIYEYNCTTDWDLSTCSYTNSFLGTEGNVPTGMFWKWNGTRVYEVGAPKMYQYDCSIPWILDSCVNSTDTLAVRGAATAMFWEANGTSLFELDMTGKRVYQYDCSSDPWNLGACGNVSDPYTLEGASSRGLSWRNDGEKLYEADDNMNKFYQHSCRSYPENSWLEIGTPDGLHEWNYTGNYTTTERTSNLISAVSSYLSGCSIVGGVCLVPFLFHSDAIGIISYLNMFFSNEGAGEVSQTYNTSTYETAQETFSINLTYNSTLYTSIAADLHYNNTEYAGTMAGSGNNVVFARTIQIPRISGMENRTFYWTIAVTNSSGTTYSNSSFNNQSVDIVNLTLCSAAPQDVAYVNFTFKNETVAQEDIEASIPSSTLVYWLGDGSINRTLSFSDVTENGAYGFCFSPSDKTTNIDLKISYSNSGAPQRTYATSSTFTNTTTNTTLWLLPSTDGQYVTFQITNLAGQPIGEVLVSISRTGYGEVASGYTDASGGLQFWLNPNYAYVITVSKSGYVSASYTITPTETSYTLTLGEEIEEGEDYTRGISYSILPPIYEHLLNHTAYNFNFTISSTYWSLDSYGFVLVNGSGTVLGSASGSVATGSTVDTTVNTGNHTVIIMDFYWETNGTFSNSSVTWMVWDSADTGWSINTFFTDLKNFVTDGIFGLNTFSLALLSFIVIFVFTGILSYKFGLSSPAAIMGVITALVLFFDVGVGLIPSPSGTIPHLPSVFVIVIFLALAIREVTR